MSIFQLQALSRRTENRYRVRRKIRYDMEIEPRLQHKGQSAGFRDIDCRGSKFCGIQPDYSGESSGEKGWLA